jgi:hypothetical protein
MRSLRAGQIGITALLFGGYAALYFCRADLSVGKGRVVAFNFNPLHRDMNRGDQKLLWNVILNWQAIVSRR